MNGLVNYSNPNLLVAMPVCQPLFSAVEMGVQGGVSFCVVEFTCTVWGEVDNMLVTRYVVSYSFQ